MKWRTCCSLSSEERGRSILVAALAAVRILTSKAFFPSWHFPQKAPLVRALMSILYEVRPSERSCSGSQRICSLVVDVLLMLEHHRPVPLGLNSTSPPPLWRVRRAAPKRSPRQEQRYQRLDLHRRPPHLFFMWHRAQFFADPASKPFIVMAMFAKSRFVMTSFSFRSPGLGKFLEMAGNALEALRFHVIIVTEVHGSAFSR